MVEDLGNSSCALVSNNQSRIDDSMSRMGTNGTNNHGHVGYMLNNYLSKNVQKFTYMSAGTAPIMEIKKKIGNANTNGMSVIEMEPITTPPKISTCRRKEGDHIYRPGDISLHKSSIRNQDQPSRRRVYSERGRRDNGYIQYPPYPNIFMKSNPVFASSIPFSVPQYASGPVGGNGETLRYMAPPEAFYYGQISVAPASDHNDFATTPPATGKIGESGYHSETSPININDGDPDANSAPRNYSEVVAGNGKSDEQSPSTSSPRTYSAVVAGNVPRANGILRGNSKTGDQEQIAKAIPLTTISRMDILSDNICLYYEKVTQSEGTLFKKLRLRDALYYRIAHYFPVCGLYIVGSSLNGFGNDKSDMDLCLMITNQELDQKTDAINVLRTVEYLVSSLPELQSCQLIEAKVPILRIVFKDGLTVDLNANNSVAIRNTHLLCYYAFSDWRVRPLVSIVKEWAKRCNINDASKASFTSYSLVLMVIHFLQCGLENPVLPSLQDKYPEVFDSRVDVRTLNVSVNLDPPVPIGNPDIPLGQLLIGFFRYYAVVYNYERNVISVRLGRLVERSELMNRNRMQWSPICIEEPFTLLNTAHSIFDVNVFNAIRAKFQEAYDILSQTYDIEKLLDVEPYRSPYAFQPSSSQS